MVKPAQSAVSVDEVRGCQLVQSLQSHRGAVNAGIARFCSSTQLPLVHKNGERFLPCTKERGEESEKGQGHFFLLSLYLCALAPVLLQRNVRGRVHALPSESRELDL